MRVVILCETQPGETRVALMPDAVKALVGLGNEVAIETGLGSHVGIPDADYSAVGATVGSDRAALLASADLVAGRRTGRR